MEKIINRLIDEAVVDVDKYVNNNSTWLIFTESKQWVIELTKDGTLWYNYNFFKNLFVYMSMDVVENQHYITKWVEDNIINGVKHLRHRKGADDSRAENIIQNGVKIKPALESHEGFMMGTPYVDKFFSKEDVEDTVINGVKEAKPMEGWVNSQKIVDKTIQNGVKETRSVEEGTFTSIGFGVHVEETIQNVVKDTRWMSDWVDNKVENTIQNGVKYTGGIGNPMWMGRKVEDAVENGVKHTIDTTHHKNKLVEDAIENGVKETLSNFISSDVCVEDIIQNGVKEVKGLPDMSGELRGYGNYYHKQKDRTKPHTQYVDDVIENSIKEKL